MTSENKNLTKHRYDIIIIGGGPAGSTAASLLSSRGWSVCLLEKECHPRFHIGESLLPMNLPIFERLGVMDEIRKIGIKKNAAEFNATDTLRPIDTFYFGESLTNNPPHAFQVLREELDYLLLENSRKRGATVIEEMTVINVQLDGNRKQITATDSKGADHEYECRFIIDASGRDSFLASKLNLKKKNRKHNSAAIYCHYRNVVRREGTDAGNISIYWVNQGWIWMIPLRNNIMSIGVVCSPAYMKTRQAPLDQFLWETLARVPDIKKRLINAYPAGNASVAANYSYTSSRMAGDGYLLVGDAYTFLDPVFSSGVFLAMQSAELGSEVVDTILKNPDLARKSLKRFEKKVHQSLASFSWFIYRFNFYPMRHLLMHNPGVNASQHFRTVKAAVISVFSGENHHHRTLLIPLLIFKINFYFLTLAKLRTRVVAIIQQKIFRRSPSV